MSTLLICNAKIVNEGLIKDADVFIREGRIEKIDLNLSHLSADRFIDASGLHLMPGMIDTHFSLDSIIDSKTSLQQEAAAATAGGITSIFLVPNASHERFSPSAFSVDMSEVTLQCNVSNYHAATHSTLDTLAAIDASRCCGVYVDMSSTDDDLRIDDTDTLEQVLTNASVIVALQAEDAPSILVREESYRQIYGDDIPFHLHGSIRSSEACYIAASSVMDIALKTQSSVHLLQVSSAKEVELLGRVRKQSLDATADVCSHYLTFSDADYIDREGTLKCNPAIKSDIDRAALMQGLLDNNINNISSGHRPIDYLDKQGGYFEVPSGLPLAQYALPSILEHYQDQILSLESIVQKVSHSVADRFLVVDRGYVREGYWADLVLVDLEGSFIARDEDVISGAAWTIFNGNEFRSSVLTTIVNGVVVWDRGHVFDAHSAGQSIAFATTR